MKFHSDDKVLISNQVLHLVEEQRWGTVIGISAYVLGMPIYIVQLDTPYHEQLFGVHKAITVQESLLTGGFLNVMNDPNKHLCQDQ